MSTKRILLSGGRAPATLELARILSSQGHHISVVESIPYHVCQHSRFVNQSLSVPSPRTHPKDFNTTLMQHIEREKIDVFIPTCEEIFTVALAYDTLSTLCQCWFEPLNRLDSLHNKWTFIQQATQLSTKLPHTRYLTCMNEMETALAHNPGLSWILKPVYSRFSAHVQEVSHKRKPTPILISNNRPWILQEKINGRQICTYSVSYQGRLLLYSAYTAPYTAGRGAAILFSPYQNPSLQQRVKNWLHQKKWTGHISFDWIQDASGEIIPIECNPRITSGIHLFGNTDTLGLAFTSPGKIKSVITPKKPQKKMLALGMAFYGIQSCKNLRQFIAWCNMIRTHYDVVFRWYDPLPIYSQLQSLLYFWKISRRKNITLIEASTEDINWNGGF